MISSEYDRLVEENYDLIGTFLHIHGYHGDAYYDAAVDGLLKAARLYCERPGLRDYKFSTIAFRQMDDAVYTVARKDARRSEIARILQLEDPLPNREPFTRADYLADPTQDVEESVAERLLTAQMLSALTEKQMEVFRLKQCGYTYNEMAQQCGIGYYGVSSRLQRMRSRLRRLQVTMEWA